MNLRSLHQKIALRAQETLRDGVITNVDDDDCAVVRFPSETLVVTTDFINSSPAIMEMGQGSWYNLGQLVVCHNFADLAGAGCHPQFFLSGICVPPTTTEDEILDFTQGVCDTCLKYDCSLIGGDTKFGGARSIYGTAFGIPMCEDKPFLRTNAKVGYKIVASRAMGSFAAAVVCLHIGEQKFAFDELNQARAQLLNTYVPFDLAQRIASFGASCAGTDISDGLGTDLKDICRSSKLSAMIRETAIPVSNFTRTIAARLDVPDWSFSFASGGDFACVFGVPGEMVSECIQAGGILIGEFVEGSAEVSSEQNGKALVFGGHTANRTQSFPEEILSNIGVMKEFYVTRF